MLRRRHRAPLAVALGAGLFACVDLFHSTNFETACDIDAAACSVGDDSSALSDAGPTAFPANFCAWDPETARANAQRACAWLGACAGPIGDDAFGPCFVRAMLAYDCAANPNRPLAPGTPVHDFWDRLWRAASCSDVRGALFASNVIPACVVSPSAYENCFFDSGTLISCRADDGGPPSTAGVESCWALGKTCASIGSSVACAGSSTACSGDDAGTWCSGTQLHDCEPDAGPFDQGSDCASFGETCVAGSPSACAANGESCPPSAQLRCNGDVAIGCPSGFSEQVDCAAILGTTGSCNADAAGRPWDVARACTVDGEPCPPDSCTGTLLASCARGAALNVDCTAVGFASCTTVQLPDATSRAICASASPEDAGTD